MGMNIGQCEDTILLLYGAESEHKTLQSSFSL
jgi:hypothetical protein